MALPWFSPVFAEGRNRTVVVAERSRRTCERGKGLGRGAYPTVWAGTWVLQERASVAPREGSPGATLTSHWLP